MYFVFQLAKISQFKRILLSVLHDSVPDDNVFIENAVVRHAVVGSI